MDKNEIKYIREKYYPIVLAIISFIMFFTLTYFVELNYGEPFENIVNAIITFSSIIVGFIGVLLGLMSSIRDKPIIIELFKRSDIKVLRRYFNDSLSSGIILIFFSMFLFLEDYLSRNCYISSFDIFDILVVIWVGLLTYTVLCTWRIFQIITNMLFSNTELPDIHHHKIDEKDEKKLQRQFSEKNK